jgi:hypothetical protein
MNHNFELKKRLDTIFFQIIEIPPNMREDMRRLWRPARALWDELDREFVVCRRQNKLTPKYQEIQKDIQERMEVIEQYLTFAFLTRQDN